MNRILFTLLLSVFFFAQQGYAQVGKICNWENNKKCAVVLTFDDWTAGQYPLAVPELKKRNIPATFFLITNFLGESWVANNWSTVLITAANGNEISNHTTDHSGQASPNASAINGAKAAIESNVPGTKVCTFAYPLGQFSSASFAFLRANGYIGAREVAPSTGHYSYDFVSSLDDYYKVTTTTVSSALSLNAFSAEINNVIAGGGLLTYMYHSVSSPTIADATYSALTVSEFSTQLDALSSYKSKVWITTFEKALKYHRERKCASLTELAAPNGLQWVVNLTDTLYNNSLYNQELSLQLKMNGVNYDEVFQNNKALQIDSVFNDTIMFRAVPDGGAITLKASAGISISAALTPIVVYNNVATNVHFTSTAIAALPHVVSQMKLNLTAIGGGSAVSMNTLGNSNYDYTFNVAAGVVSGDKTILLSVTDDAAHTLTYTLHLEVSGGIVVSAATVNPATVENTSDQQLTFDLQASDDGSVSGVKLDLSAIGGGAALAMTSGDAHHFTLNYVLPAFTSTGTKVIVATVTDNLGNTKTQNISLLIKAGFTYSDIYTDAFTRICVGCYWTTGTLAEQLNLGAIEGVKDYSFDYKTKYDDVNFNICNWLDVNAMDFSAFDSLELSYKGPVTPGAVLSVNLVAVGDVKSNTVLLTLTPNYVSTKVAVSAFSGVNLSQIKLLRFAVDGGSTAAGNIRLDNIRLSKTVTSVVTGVDDFVHSASSATVYPNPFNETITIKVNSTKNATIDLKVYSLIGDLVYASATNVTNENIVMGEYLQAGIYLVEVTVEGQKQFSKICKQ